MFKKITTTVLLALMMPMQIFAQFSLTGNIIDKENHEALVGAHVSLKELNLITVTDENGIFKFENIKNGTYTLEATYLGFKKYSSDVKIVKDTKIKIAMTMDSMMEDEVIVTA